MAKNYDDEDEGFSDKPSSPKKRDYDDEHDDREDDDLNIRKRAGNPGEVPNFMAQAVMVTLFCCMPFGIVAIVKAAEVNTMLARGDYEKAVQASEEAKKYCWISFVLGIIAGPILIALQIAGEMHR